MSATLHVPRWQVRFAALIVLLIGLTGCGGGTSTSEQARSEYLGVVAQALADDHVFVDGKAGGKMNDSEQARLRSQIDAAGAQIFVTQIDPVQTYSYDEPWEYLNQLNGRLPGNEPRALALATDMGVYVEGFNMEAGSAATVRESATSVFDRDASNYDNLSAWIGQIGSFMHTVPALQVNAVDSTFDAKWIWISIAALLAISVIGLLFYRSHRKSVWREENRSRYTNRQAKLYGLQRQITNLSKQTPGYPDAESSRLSALSDIESALGLMDMPSEKYTEEDDQAVSTKMASASRHYDAASQALSTIWNRTDAQDSKPRFFGLRSGKPTRTVKQPPASSSRKSKVRRSGSGSSGTSGGSSSSTTWGSHYGAYTSGGGSSSDHSTGGGTYDGGSTGGGSHDSGGSGNF